MLTNLSTLSLSTHTHSDLALATHTHSNLAASDHTHTGFAASNHTHSDLALANHTHATATRTESGITPLSTTTTSTQSLRAMAYEVTSGGTHDLNNYTQPGIYCIYSPATTSNFPTLTNGSVWGTGNAASAALEVVPYYNTQVRQIISRRATNDVWIRHNTSATNWSSWQLMNPSPPVIPSASVTEALPLAATATVGTATAYARADHVHPTTGISTVPTNHASTATTYGAASRTNWGHARMTSSHSTSEHHALSIIYVSVVNSNLNNWTLHDGVFGLDIPEGTLTGYPNLIRTLGFISVILTRLHGAVRLEWNEFCWYRDIGDWEMVRANVWRLPVNTEFRVNSSEVVHRFEINEAATMAANSNQTTSLSLTYPFLPVRVEGWWEYASSSTTATPVNVVAAGACVYENYRFFVYKENANTLILSHRSGSARVRRRWNIVVYGVRP